LKPPDFVQQKLLKKFFLTRSSSNCYTRGATKTIYIKYDRYVNFS